MIYNLRSKRDAVHVKELNPTYIDVSLAVAGASWVIAELIRMYHVSDEKAITETMIVLSRATIPMIEKIDGESFVGRKVPAPVEILLLLAHARPSGKTRKELGKAAKCSQPAVTTALKSLLKDRHVHLTDSGCHFITGAGEQHLAHWVTSLG